MFRASAAFLVLMFGFIFGASAAPPKLSIIHFDVNQGDATLIISPGGKGILIDAGNPGYGKDPIVEYLERAKKDGRLRSLEYTIVTHYDADHLGGMDEVYRNGWYPSVAAYDRGNKWMRPFKEGKRCTGIDMGAAEQLVPWGTVPKNHCDRFATCQTIEYLTEATAGGKRTTMRAGDAIELDHGLKLTALVANAKDIDGDSVDVFYDGRKADCADNDLSIGLLLTFGDFRYLIAGDLTGNRQHKVANVERLITDDARRVDVYHVNHHGSNSSSNAAFMKALDPTVAIVSSGRKFCHPEKNVIRDRILGANPDAAIFLTNKPKSCAWNAPSPSIADRNANGVDGIVELAVWRRSYRVFLWEHGKRRGTGSRFLIRERSD